MRRSSASASTALRSSSARASLTWLFTRSRTGGMFVVGDSVMCSRCRGFCCAGCESGGLEGGVWEAVAAGDAPVLAARPKRGMALEKLEVKRLPKLRGFMALMKFVAAARGSLWESLAFAGEDLVLLVVDWGLRLMLLVVLLALSTLRSRVGPRPARISRVRLLLFVVLGLAMGAKGSSGDERPDPARRVSSSAGEGVETSLRASSRVFGSATGFEPGVTWSFKRPKSEFRLFSRVPLIES